MTGKVERGLEVRRIVRHAAADVALLELNSKWAEVFDPFLRETSLFDWGIHYETSRELPPQPGPFGGVPGARRLHTDHKGVLR
jgi:hypothetical protein